MDLGLAIVWPVMLILARVSAFLVAAPVFGSGLVPKSIKVGMTLILTAFFLYILPPKVATPATPLAACLLMGQEVVYGLAIGLAAHMVYLSVQQAGVMLAQQMGLADAEVIDPTTGQESESLATFMELTFAVLFLGAGGHHLLLAVLGKSYHVFAAGTSPDIATMAGAITTAGSTMMLFALKLAAPCLAAFLVLTTVLAVLARALPDLNIFFESYPLRMGLGMIMAAAMMPSLGYFNGQLSMWIQRIFT